jgi:hypothetical protein
MCSGPTGSAPLSVAQAVAVRDGAVVLSGIAVDGYTHRGLSALADVDGNGGAEIVVLQQRDSDRKAIVRIIDGRTGVTLRSIPY